MFGFINYHSISSQTLWISRKGAPITIRNFPGEKPIIEPGNPPQRRTKGLDSRQEPIPEDSSIAPPGICIQLHAKQGHTHKVGWITIEGFELRFGFDGVRLYNGHDVIIRNNYIHENFNQGILANGGNRVWIDRNRIVKNGTNVKSEARMLHGIYVTGSKLRITNNIIHTNLGFGIQVVDYDYDKKWHAGPEFAEANDLLISNNTLAYNQYRGGITLWGQGRPGISNCIVQNNIFYGNISGKKGGKFKGHSIWIHGKQPNKHIIRNNIFFPSDGREIYESEQNTYKMTNNKTSN